jgi:GNAT superfamily N-acetyltransferase
VITRARSDDEPRRAITNVTFRPASSTELGACADIWRVSIDDYTSRLGQPGIPPELASIIRLFTHLRATDPDRFVVATTPTPDHAAERVVGFASAIERETLWYLSMLFVLPEFQGAGLGRALLDQVLPNGDGSVRAVATDSAQPISNALYASYGVVPRMPLLNLNGLPSRPEAFGPLPSGITAVPFEEIAGGPPGGDGHRRVAHAVEALDRASLGVAHPFEHRFLRMEGRHGWLYHGPDGVPLGYGYAGESGRLGPVAALDAELVPPILGHLTAAVVPRGAFAMWVAGAADRAIVAGLAAGFRLDGFPVLLCWDRPFADFGRYLPISPGLP